MEDELICYYGRWIRKDELKYKTEATNTISNKHLYRNNREQAYEEKEKEKSKRRISQV